MKPRAWQFLLAGIGALVIAHLVGCGIPTFLVSVFTPEPKENAAFTLPAGKTVLVFPDDLVNPLGYPPLKRMLAEKLNEQIAKHQLAERTIEYARLEDLKERSGERWRDVREKGMGVAEVTSALGADLAIHLDVREFRLKEHPSNNIWKGRLTALVKVVDSKGNRLWPADAMEGQQVSVETPPITEGDETYGLTLTNLLADQMADRVAKLFYSHPAGK
jgi:hypothetical protein